MRRRTWWVEGIVKGRVKGGLIVDVGVDAFLPGSQVDLVPVKNADDLLNQKLEFKILKINKGCRRDGWKYPTALRAEVSTGRGSEEVLVMGMERRVEWKYETEPMTIADAKKTNGGAAVQVEMGTIGVEANLIRQVLARESRPCEWEQVRAKHGEQRGGRITVKQFADFVCSAPRAR